MSAVEFVKELPVQSTISGLDRFSAFGALSANAPTEEQVWDSFTTPYPRPLISVNARRKLELYSIEGYVWKSSDQQALSHVFSFHEEDDEEFDLSEIYLENRPPEECHDEGFRWIGSPIHLLLQAALHDADNDCALTVYSASNGRCVLQYRAYELQHTELYTRWLAAAGEEY